MKDFKKYYNIPATPDEIYMALTNPVTMELWTGEVAEMSTEAGSEFSMWDGSITGKNLEFEPGKKIVQQWYFEGESDNSVVTIKLHPDKKGSSVELRHTNIPDADYDGMVDGWNNSYFGALQEFFEGE
ncbi:SRPBCC domain-containing protein [Mucilaginibacter sabulilitoris]|uniref:SRPBCC domain-containing protein n=1 Tax=Mucilaginibacter sabulilitoris TaxID=1173583 RepID=A0ABZ0TJE3_9SPHI|nr:SRPBCC domain-containing protein [Mucilaginibacter sabulilitoris]WPU91315.1 SRPBCC domain-containing protein [Mucilaginibacter sabulilitoris]